MSPKPELGPSTPDLITSQPFTRHPRGLLHEASSLLRRSRHRDEAAHPGREGVGYKKASFYKAVNKPRDDSSVADVTIKTIISGPTLRRRKWLCVTLAWCACLLVVLY